MLRGTRVGKAYVDITADGSGLNEDIADQIEDVDWDGFGDKHGREYKRAVKRHLRAMEEDFDKLFKAQNGAKSSRASKAFDTEEAIDLRVSKMLAKALDDDKSDLKMLADRLGGEFSHDFGEGFDREITAEIYDSMERTLQKLARDRNLDLSKVITGKSKIGDKDLQLLGPLFEQARKDVERLVKVRIDFEKYAAQLTKRYWDQTWREAHRENARRDRERLKNARERERFERMIVKAHAEALRLHALFDQGKLDGQGYKIPSVSGNSGGGGRSAAFANIDFDSRTSGVLGKLFGAGSRSDFLNFYGRSFGVLTKIILRTDDVVKGLGSSLQTISAGFQSGGFSGGVAAFGQQMSKAFSGLASSGPAALAVLAAILISMSVMISVTSALVGIVTALAATIASALVGALLVAGAAIAAVTASVGLLIVAFTSLTDTQSERLKATFAPVLDVLRGLGQLVLDGLIPAFQTWASNLQSALVIIAPAAKVMGQAFGEAGKILTAAFSGTGFQQFATAMVTYLPSIITRLSSALGSFLNGALSLFAVLQPYVDRFAGYLARVAANFAKWAGSAQGQNSIKDFAERALTSLESLWNFARQFFGWIGDILFSPAAQNAGNMLFDSLTQAFEGFRAAIADGSLEKWFADAIEFAYSLGDGIGALWDMFAAFYDSGVLQGVGIAIDTFVQVVDLLTAVLKPLVDILGYVLPVTLQVALTPIQAMVAAIVTLGEAVEWVLGLIGVGDGADWEQAAGAWQRIGDNYKQAFTRPEFLETQEPEQRRRAQSRLTFPNFTAGGLAGRGAAAREYVNPYTDWANSLINNGPKFAAEMAGAMKRVNKEVSTALAVAARADSLQAVRDGLGSQVNGLIDQGKNLVQEAQSNLNSAAQTLANANTREEVNKALADVKVAQADLAKAQSNQRRLNNAARILKTQQIVRSDAVKFLVGGGKTNNATLAEYARAREIVADKLEKANQKLADAIALRDDYRKQVTDSIKSFGSLITAEAKTVNGVAQALTATDITDNLKTRLAKIQAFQANLRRLLALGLSNDAYKQIVDAGVEEGSAYAEALVAGGTGAVNEVNGLVSSINNSAKQLGLEASNRMYQAGVDAARGLVEGLESLSEQLDSAAAKLGKTIATAVKRELGIKSPSRVLMGAMDYVGDGTVIGLDNQASKVDAAASRFANRIALTPDQARISAYQSAIDAAAVSGNQPQQPLVGELNVHTPTEDPMGVAKETLNELTGRFL